VPPGPHPRLHHRRRARHAILTHLGLPTGPPPLIPARGPPQPELAFDTDPDLDLDQTPVYDLTEPEPIPDFDFDQSAGA
jgi:hypothetical protein